MPSMPKTHKLLPALALASAVLAGCGGSGSATSTPATGAPASQSSATTGGSAPSGTVACTYENDGTQAAKKVSLPPAQASNTGQVKVTMATSVGDFHATLDAAKTPCTVNSFVSLAKQGFFDNTSCHRLVTQGIFVLQCGDPTGTGSGGPGYSFADELSGSESYPAGTLAMANAGPNTNGSQFFIVFGDSPLPPSYTVFGQVDAASVKLAKSVAQKGSDHAFPDGSGHPNEKVEITGVTVG